MDRTIHYLEHHGIKGQRWGIRRYQNADGTLTALGRKRAAKHDLNSMYSMSDDELRNKAQRLELENRYRRAYSEANPSLKKRLAAGIIGGILVAGASEGGKIVISNAIRKAASSGVLKKGAKTIASYVLSHSDGGELYHHGIKGQRWGIRRYQNADGSLTSAGKSRYGLGSKHSISNLLKYNPQTSGIPRPKSQGPGTKTYPKAQKPKTAMEKLNNAGKKAIDRKSIEHIQKTLAQKDKNIAKAHENHNRIVAKAKKTGKSAAEIEQEESSKSEKFHLSDKQKTALKVGAAVTVAALVTYGAYKYSSTRKQNFNNMLLKAAESGKTDFLKSAFGDKGNFSAFSNTSENKNLLNMALTSSSSKWWNNLSKAEKAGIEQYSTNAYKKMNNALWAAKGENIFNHTDLTTARNITAANMALKKASFPMDMVCTQGLTTEKACKFLGCSPNDLFKAANDPEFASRFIGNVNTNHGLFSTTSTAGGGFNGGVKYSVLTPKGAHAAFIEHISNYGDLPHPPSWNGKKSGGPPFSSEFETLFAAGSKFKTRGIRYNKAGGYIEVALEYLLDD